MPREWWDQYSPPPQMPIHRDELLEAVYYKSQISSPLWLGWGWISDSSWTSHLFWRNLEEQIKELDSLSCGLKCSVKNWKWSHHGTTLLLHADQKVERADEQWANNGRKQKDIQRTCWRIPIDLLISIFSHFCPWNAPSPDPMSLSPFVPIGYNCLLFVNHPLDWRHSLTPSSLPSSPPWTLIPHVFLILVPCYP